MWAVSQVGRPGGVITEWLIYRKLENSAGNIFGDLASNR